MFNPLFLSKSTSGGGLMALIWIVILFVFMYFIMIRPQQKETKKKNAL